MLYLNAVGLVDDLTPTVFTCRLSTKHCQFLSWELEIMVALDIGKEEVGLLVVLGDGLLFKYINKSWIFLENVNNVARVSRNH